MNDPTQPPELEGASGPPHHEALMGALFDAVRVGIVVVAPEGRRLRVNRAFCEMTGFSEAEVLAQDYRTQLHPEDFQHNASQREALLAGACESYTAHRRYQRRNHGWFWVSITVSAVRDVHGLPTCTVAVVEDITRGMQAAQALAESEDRYRLTFDHVAIGLLHVSADGRLLHVNRQMCSMLGYSEPALHDNDFAVCAHPDEQAGLDLQLQRLYADEVAFFTAERRYRHRDGHWIWGNATVSLIRRIDGTPDYTITAVQDITARRLIEDDLRASEARFRATFEQAPFAIAHFDHEGRWLRINRKFVELFGYELEELSTRTWVDLNHPDELPLRAENLRRLHRGEVETLSREKRYLHRDGSVFWAQVNTSLVRDRAGRVAYFVASLQDVTDRRHAQDQLCDSEARFRNLIEFSTDWYWEQDDQFRFTVLVASRQSDNDRLRESHLGKHRWDIPWRIDAGAWEAHRAMLDRREPFRDFVLSRVAGDGSLRHISVSGEPVFDGGGRFTGYRGVSSDITRRIAAEERLRESESRSRLLALVVEQSSEAIVIKDLDNRVLTWNAGAEKLFDYSAAEAIGTNLTRLLTPDCSEERVQRRIAEVRSGQNHTFRNANRARSGQMIEIEVTVSPLHDEAGNHIGEISVTRDMTASIAAGHALRESERRNRLLAAVVNQTTEAIITKDLDNNVLTWNPGATTLFGYTAEEAVGRNISRLVIPGADDKRVQTAIQGSRTCRTLSRLETRRTRDGRTFDVEVSYSPLLDSEGMHIGEISIARDITARLTAERTLRASEAKSRLLAAVVEQSSEAIVIKDLDNIVLSWNGGAERIYGWSSTEATGKNITLLVRPRATGADVAGRIARLRLGQTGGWRAQSQRRDGSLINVDVNVSPLYDETGRHIGEITMARDITERERSDAALRSTQARNRELALIVDQSYDAIITKDTDNRILTWNGSASRIFGWTSDEVIGRNFLSVMKPGAGAPELLAAIERIRSRQAETWETVRFTKSGERLHVEVTVSPMFDDDGRHRGEISINRDISQRIQAEETLRDHRLFLEQAQAVGGIGSWAVSLADNRLTWSDETVRIFGLTREQFDGRVDSFWSRVHPEDVERVRSTTGQAVESRSVYTNEYRIIRADGSQRWLHEHAAIICDDGGRPVRVVGVAQDITERRAARERIEFLATRDPLTELPNRLLLRDRITHGMAAAARNGTLLALLFIDLDRFKTINDSLGHRVGDELLKQVAERLTRCVRKDDTLARLGGDEFVVLLAGLQDSQVASQVARKVLKLLARPCVIEGHELSTSCSIGIALYPADGTDAQALMKNADAAMYHAKERGRGNYQYFSADLHSRAVERLSIESALRRALERDEFELHFQPQVRVADARVVGMEALLRWNHPEEGLMAPGRFIRIAEESGLIVPLGEWALNAACAQVRQWFDQGLSPPRLAVNVSVGQLSRGFVRSVGRALQLHRLDGAMLELEMTESLLMQHVDENVKLLRRLGELGVQVALDDFGTGYSSLAYLKKFPIDALKIDRTFVRDIVEDPDDSAITAAVISIGHHMQLRVVAEGVETAEQLQILQSMGCDEYQGYLFSRPVPAQTFAARFLAAGTSERRTDLPSG